MTLLELFKIVNPSVLAAKIIFKNLQTTYPVVKISDIAKTTSGGTPNRSNPEYYNGTIPWVKSGELKDSVIMSSEEYITEDGLKNSSAKLFPKGTLLVAMYGANIGKTGILNFDATTNQAACAIFPKIDISRDFLYWFFKQQRLDFIAIAKGGAQPNISQTVINNASIVIPELEIQDKIVKFLQRIEEGDGIDYNFFIPGVLNEVETIYNYKNNYINLTNCYINQLNLIKQLDQAILQEAVQGKLVPQDPEDEPAFVLLERIKTEKAQSGKKEKQLPAIKPEEIPFAIPENWVWCRLGEICEYIIDCPHSTPKYLHEITGFYAIDTTCIETDSSISKLRNISESGYNERIKRLEPMVKDIVFAREGSIGLSAFIPEHKKVCLGQRVILFRCGIDLLPEYLKLVVTNKKYLHSLLDKHRGIGAKHINVKDIKLSLIPLPPLAEQKRIVAEIEKQFAKTKQLKQHVLANQEATEQLLKALLHQAFEVGDGQ
jgi:type I restriction enzyme, S subunit